MAILLSLALGAPACSPKRPAHQHTATFTLERTGSDDEMGATTWAKFQQLFDLYAVNGRLSKVQITNLLEHFSPKFSKLVNASFDVDGTDNFSFQEFSAMLERKCATLAWLKLGSLRESKSRLTTLRQAFPEANEPLILELDQLMGEGFLAQMSLDETLRIGVYLSQGLDQFAKQAETPSGKMLLQRLLAKTMWSSAPSLTTALENNQDQQISRLILVLRFRHASSVISGQEKAPDHAASNLEPVLSNERARHRLYLHLILAQNPLVKQEQAIEELDWELNSILGQIIQNGPHDLLVPHLNQSYPQLFANWNSSSPFFTFASVGSVMDDLLMANLTDDLMQTCGLTPTRPLDKEFVEIFADRVKTENSKSEISCPDVEKLFHPDAFTYSVLKLKAGLRRIRF